MRGWRIKFVFLLIVYFGGFATAIYTLAPVQENKTNASQSKMTAQKSSLYPAFKSDEFTKSLNTGLHKCIEFCKDAALRTAKLIKQKIEERQLQADS